MIDKKTVEKIAHLSRLNLSDAEKDSMVGQMDKIVGYVEQLRSVDTTGVEPTSFVVPEGDHLRDDTLVESLSIEAALANGPSVTKGHFAIPKVIG
jgi:aspartyl-tRNA(Asn)/glutamyl-tRNA(Gln) amidotransferase subunit C